MRSFEELENIIFADWTREEVARASIEGVYPEDEKTRLRNLEIVLPEIDFRLQEELLALAEVKRTNPSDPYVKEWAGELAVMEDLVERGLALGAEHQLWHKKDATCPKCEETLERMEQSVCARCRGGRTPMQ